MNQIHYKKKYDEAVRLRCERVGRDRNEYPRESWTTCRQRRDGESAEDEGRRKLGFE